MKKRSHYKYMLFFVVLGVLLTVLFYSLKNFQTQKAGRESKQYYSSNLKFTVDVPKGFVINDSIITVALTRDNEEITIIRNGTNYDNVKEYLLEFDERRQLTEKEAETVVINGNEAVSRIIEKNNNREEIKSYYIYKDYAVYILSTSSESLFDELDHVAQSFRYTP